MVATQGFDAGWGRAGPPTQDAAEIETVIDVYTQQPAIGMVRHASHPFQATLRSEGLRDIDRWLPELGRRYLQELDAALGIRQSGTPWLHPQVWQRLIEAEEPQRKALCPARLQWLRLTWGPDVPKEDLRPLGSFWVPSPAPGRRKRMGSLVLLAGNVDEDTELQAGDDLGLRIVVHVDGRHLRIHGVTVAGLAGPRALEAVPEDIWPHVTQALKPIRTEIQKTLNVGPLIWIRNIEVSESAKRGAPATLTVSGRAQRQRDLQPRADKDAASRRPFHDFRVEIEGRSTRRVLQILRDNYVGSAGSGWRDVASMLTDPASAGPPGEIQSRRPTRSDTQLHRFASPVSLDLGATDELRYPARGTCWFKTWSPPRPRDPASVNTVARSAAAVPLADRSAAKDAALRSDLRGAIEAHVRASDLFSRLQAYGLGPEAYFRFARLPLVQRIRPSMIWAPDGELPNAEVRPYLEGSDLDPGSHPRSDRMRLQVRYGSASPTHRRVLPGEQGRRKAQYLSIACDHRWAWHEFGHVLAFASTGELEFPFAHSAGDALAAIAADPQSELAAAGVDDPARFITFPWIEVPGRSHGRPAEGGYCWCGRRNVVRLQFNDRRERYHHSYFGEQLLSSSLFRLYRCLGGDTWPGAGDSASAASDLQTRLAASDYCIYLIMRAISLLGSDTLAPARTPDQFVSALIDADLGTGRWKIDAGWPFDLNEPEVRTVDRLGGLAHKLVRWAFERQGLYATSNPTGTREGPGLPPAVDVFIADRRPAVDTETPPGSGDYVPVPLHPAMVRGQMPLWTAQEQAIWRVGRIVNVRVGNRGHRDALGVKVTLWWRADLRAAWTRVGVSPEQTTPVPPQQDIVLQFDVPVGRGMPWFLARVDARADPANEPAGGTPPQDAADLMQLVAFDNNWALARLGR